MTTDRKYLDWVKDYNIHDCILCLAPCDDPHHVTYAEEKSASTKVGDEYAVPLCRPCHNVVHAYQGPEEEFWIRMGVDPLEHAERLWAEWLEMTTTS